MIYVELEERELKDMITYLSELGVANYIKEFSPKLDLISEREAFRKFKESAVKKWVENNIVDFKRMGGAKNSKKRYSYSELLTAEITCEILKQLQTTNYKLQIKKLLNN